MKVNHNRPLAGFTTLGVGGPAETLLELASDDSLQSVLISHAHEQLWVLGDGTNCLISDQGLPGTVIINKSGSISHVSPTRLQASSGVSWDDLIQKAISLNLFGLEFTSGVPGSVGAAIVGNIAAYGQKVADCFVEATLFDPRSQTTAVWHSHDMDFAYRSSSLQQPEHRNLIVLDATFDFSPTATSRLEYATALKVADELGIPADSLANRRAVILETRRRIGSLLDDVTTTHKSAGSFFKNPLVSEAQMKIISRHEEATTSPQQIARMNQLHSGDSIRVSAAHVLLAAGFKRGQTWGNVRLHPDHILKLENTGKATAQEIYNVVQDILHTVKERLGIVLEPEVRFLGEF